MGDAPFLAQAGCASARGDEPATDESAASSDQAAATEQRRRVTAVIFRSGTVWEAEAFVNLDACGGEDTPEYMQTAIALLDISVDMGMKG